MNPREHPSFTVYARDDAELQGRIDRLPAGFGYTGHRVRARVFNGVVTLEGSVSYERDIRAAGSLVGRVEGVVAVENLLLYRLPDPAGAQPGTG